MFVHARRLTHGCLRGGTGKRPERAWLSVLMAHGRIFIPSPDGSDGRASVRFILGTCAPRASVYFCVREIVYKRCVNVYSLPTMQCGSKSRNRMHCSSASNFLLRNTSFIVMFVATLSFIIGKEILYAFYNDKK